MDHHSKLDHKILENDDKVKESAAPGLLRTLQSSLTAKIFLISFISIHLPLLAMVTYVAINGLGNTMNTLILLLVTTLLGTIVCFSAVWWLIRPLRRLRASIEHYREKGVLLPIDTPSPDEIGVVSSAISSLVTDMDEMVRKLRFDANTDVLTGLANRRLMLTRGPEELAKALQDQETSTSPPCPKDESPRVSDWPNHK